MEDVKCPNPLKPEDCAALNAILQSAHATELLIAKCKDCGIPVEQQEADNAQQRAIAQNIKRHFFPHNA